MEKISFVIPCYRSENTIKKVVTEIESVVIKDLYDYDYEIVLVDDHSPDGVWSVIKQLAKDNCKIKGCTFSKNYGQHSALLAGYSYCEGDYVVSLDDDGQTPIDEVKKLVDELEQGYDVVYAYYGEIKQRFYRKFGTWMSNKMSEIMLGSPKGLKGSSFYIARKYIIDEMINYKNPFPYLGGLVLRITKNVSCVETKHRPRLEGSSGYTLKKLLALWVSGFTAFSTKPVLLFWIIGMLFSFIGFALFIAMLVILIMGGKHFLALVFSIFSVGLFVGGIITLLLALLSEYISRTYICINNAPQYVIKEKIGV